MAELVAWIAMVTFAAACIVFGVWILRKDEKGELAAWFVNPGIQAAHLYVGGAAILGIALFYLYAYFNPPPPELADPGSFPKRQ